MTEEEKKAIWWLEEVVADKEEYKKTHAWVGSVTLDYIETLLNLIQRQDRQIDLMAEHIEKGCDFDSRIQTKDCIKQYFAEQAKEV